MVTSSDSGELLSSFFREEAVVSGGRWLIILSTDSGVEIIDDVATDL
jgi:hypothetical protein